MDQEAPGLRDARDHLGEVGCAPGWQRFERRHLDAHRGLATAVAAGHHLVDEAPPAGEIGKVPRAAQDQGLVEGDLEVVVVGLDRPVLMR